MPHAVQLEQPAHSVRPSKLKSSSSKELRQLQDLYSKATSLYIDSKVCLSISRLLDSKSRPPVTRVISLGLGSLKSVDQSRRLKQLTIFLAIAERLRQHQANLEIYAQDPTFSSTDDTFLNSLGVQILSTPSPTQLGDAAQYIDGSTLVYCPFLTLEAYQLLFSIGRLECFIGDDFDALRNKWPKHSAGRNEAELILRRFVQGFRKKVISSDDDFWDAQDKAFPMAMYWRAPGRDQRKEPDSSH